VVATLQVEADFPVVVAILAAEGHRVTGKTNSGRLSRLLRHLFTWQSKVDDAFSAVCFEQIERAIADTESIHGCEIAFVVEASLSPRQVWHNTSARERALEMFGRFGVWDTELNNGVLVYVLFADRSVELVVDRAIAKKIDQSVWESVMQEMTAQLALGEYQNASVGAVQKIGAVLNQHFKALDSNNDVNELPNKPRSI
jgi:uncharacterized membrane protein